MLQTSQIANPHAPRPHLLQFLDILPFAGLSPTLTHKWENEDEDDDEDDEDEPEEDDRPPPGESDNPLKCYRSGWICAEAPEKHPEWNWIVTAEARTMHIALGQQVFNRDQDAHDECFYNDCSGYGAFSKEYNKKSRSPVKLWHHVEAMAHFLGTGDLSTWLRK